MYFSLSLFTFQSNKEFNKNQLHFKKKDRIKVNTEFDQKKFIYDQLRLYRNNPDEITKIIFEITDTFYNAYGYSPKQVHSLLQEFSKYIP